MPPQACIYLRCSPADAQMDALGWELDLTPVDYAAKVRSCTVCPQLFALN